MDGVQLPQDQSQFEEAVYFLPLGSQNFLVLILSTSDHSTLEPPSGLEYGTPGLGIPQANLINRLFTAPQLTLDHYCGAD